MRLWLILTESSQGEFIKFQVLKFHHQYWFVRFLYLFTIPFYFDTFNSSTISLHIYLSLYGLQLSRVKWTPFKKWVVSIYVLKIYTKNPMMESILALDIPYLYSLSITTSSAISYQVSSHISWDTNPCIPPSVLITVPAHVLSTCDGGWTFMEISWIPNHEHVKPRLLKAPQHKILVGLSIRPLST